MKKTVNTIPFENLSNIFNNIDYEYAWVFTEGNIYNIKGNIKFRDFLLKLFFSNKVVKKYYSMSALKNSNKTRFYDDKRPVKNCLN